MLTEIKIKSSNYNGKNFKLHDEKGLYLLVTKNNKYWRFDYRFGGKRKTISLGVYPEVSLKKARELRDENKILLRQNVDPSEHRKQIKRENIKNSTKFKDIADKWLLENKHRWKQSHFITINYRLNRHVFPKIGNITISNIKKADILNLVKGIEKEGKLETAKRVYRLIKSVFEYAYDLEIIEHNDISNLAKKITPTKPKHYPTILELDKIKKLMSDIDNYKGSIIVKSAIELLALTFVRPGELRNAKWEEINFSEAIWDIPAETMKMGRDHRVFLSKQALEILKDLYKITGTYKYIFTFDGEKPISENTINKALKSMGYDTKKDITGHGFRAMARTLIHEKLKYSPEIIEHQLAHRVPDALGEAYNRTLFYEERKKMMQDWVNLLFPMSSEN